MRRFKWTDKYRIGIEEIDHQHMEIFDAINKLYEHLTSSSGDNSGFETVLLKLKKYIDNHFSTEMKYFVIFNYHNLSHHNKEHQQFSEKIMSYCNMDILSNKDKHDLYYILETWFEKHILNSDMDFRDSISFNNK